MRWRKSCLPSRRRPVSMVLATSIWSEIDVPSAAVREGLEPLSREVLFGGLLVEGGVVRGQREQATVRWTLVCGEEKVDYVEMCCCWRTI